MKKLLVFSAILVLLASCNKLDGETTIKPGETISNKDVSLKFVDYEDSRCPIETNCISAGHCSAWMELSDGETTLPFAMGDGESPYGTEFTGLNYKIRFVDLLPHPEDGKTITTDDYKLHLIVTKQ